jgi:hypothetical protein
LFRRDERRDDEMAASALAGELWERGNPLLLLYTAISLQSDAGGKKRHG